MLQFDPRGHSQLDLENVAMRLALMHISSIGTIAGWKLCCLVILNLVERSKMHVVDDESAELESMPHDTE